MLDKNCQLITLSCAKHKQVLVIGENFCKTYNHLER